MNNYKRAFLFNGIGSKYEKMVADMPDKMVERLNDYRSDAFKKYDVSSAFEENPQLRELVSEWITSAVCDRVIFEHYAENGIHPDICAGYSSGVNSISACLSASSFDFAYGLFFKNAFSVENLRKENIALDMGTIIGLDDDTVQEIIDTLGVGEFVQTGSVNSSICVMISGYKKYVEPVLEKALAEGAIKAIQMNVPIAFHNDYVEPYCKGYIEYCDSVTFDDPAVPVVSSVDQRIITSGSDLLFEVKTNLFKPMRWDMTVKKLQDMGVEEFYDMNPTGAVRKFSRWNKKKSKFFIYSEI